MTKIKRIGSSRLVNIPGVGMGLYSGINLNSGFDVRAHARWESEPEIVAGEKIVPYGVANRLPEEIRDLMDENNLAPGILEREKGLLFGQGYELYKKIYVDGQVVREWGYDAAIWEWLKSWDVRRYIEMAITEYKYLHGFFDKTFLNKGVRIGRGGRIMKLEVVPGVNARLAWVDSRKLEDVKHILTGDFENGCTMGITRYPVFDPNDPFRYPVSMNYRNSYSFARSLYSIPSFYGTIPWLRRSSDIPQVLQYITENSINVAFHIESPDGYWERQEERLRDKCTLEGKEYHPSMLEKHKDEILHALSKALSGKKNAGKFFHTTSLLDPEGKPWSWKITPIDQKITDFIEAQIKVSEKADSATTSGIGLHPALSNIMVDGKLSSGSEMLYALKLYLASDVTISEEVILEGINRAISYNFKTDWKLGFYHQIVLKEEDVSPTKRTKNSI